jgi:SAM-dependent methyltransferase
VRADVCDLPSELVEFDIAWTSSGVLCWITDIDAWARAAAATLAPGGRLIVCEQHPVTHALGAYGPTRGDDYFARGMPSEQRDLGFLALNAPTSESHFIFFWPLGDVVTAVARAGLVVESLQEFPHEGDPPIDRPFNETIWSLPEEFHLVARKPL